VARWRRAGEKCTVREVAEPAVVRKSWLKAKREGKSVKGRKRGKKEGKGVLWVLARRFVENEIK
jgi:hypothetical protein